MAISVKSSLLLSPPSFACPIMVMLKWKVRKSLTERSLGDDQSTRWTHWLLSNHHGCNQDCTEQHSHNQMNFSFSNHEVTKVRRFTKKMRGRGLCVSPESLLYPKTCLRPSHIRPIRPIRLIRPTLRRPLNPSSLLNTLIPALAAIAVFLPFCSSKRQNHMLCILWLMIWPQVFSGVKFSEERICSRKERYHAAIRFIISPGHHTLSANVEIGVPRSDSQRLSGFPKALFIRDYRKIVCRIGHLTTSWKYMTCTVNNISFFEKMMEVDG